MVQISLQRAVTMSPRCSLSYPLHRVGGASRRWISWRSQYSCFAYSARPSPIVLKTDSVIDPSGPNNLDASSSASRTGPYSATSNLSGTIGVMGTSAASSLRFLEKFLCWSTRDGEETPPFVIFNDPLIRKELLSSENFQLTSDCKTALGKLRQKRLFLEQSGACCIVMPCQFLHAWHDEVSQGCSVPFLHVGDCIVKELKAANFEPVVYGSNVSVGILATDNTLATYCYLDKLETQDAERMFVYLAAQLRHFRAIKAFRPKLLYDNNHSTAYAFSGFEVLCPDKASMEHTVLPAVSAFRRGDMEGARNLLRIALQVMLVRAVNTIILASDDFVGILPDDDPLLEKCINPMDALVRETILCARTLRP